MRPRRSPPPPTAKINKDVSKGTSSQLAGADEAESTLNKSLSESDISKAGETSSKSPKFVLTRSKRTREDMLNTELSDFKEEMKNMITSLFAAQENELKKINPTLKEIQVTNQNIEASISFLSEQNEELKNKINLLEKQAIEDKKYITILEDKLEDLLISSRKSNFEIKNVPRKNNEAKEDLVEMVLNLSKNIGSNVNKEDIKDIYRVRPKKDGSRNMPIIVETSSTILKTEVLKCSKAFNIKHKNKLCAKHLGLRISEDTPIFVTEQLTAKGSRLHFLARDLVKNKTYKFCWTSYGRVYVRKDENSPVITIKSEAQVHQLCNVM